MFKLLTEWICLLLKECGDGREHDAWILSLQAFLRSGLEILYDDGNEVHATGRSLCLTAIHDTPKQ